MIPLPRLITATGAEIRRLEPISASLSINITPLSSATIQLRKGDSVPIRSFVEMYTANGSAGIFRTRSPQDGYGDDVTTVELEHAIAEVGDYLVREDIEQTMTAAQAISRAFGWYNGSLWTLGTNNVSANVVLQANYNNVLETILAVLDQIPSYMLTFNQSVTPWQINIVQRPTTVTAEGRLSRNMQSVQITYDDSELCTRVFMEGLPAPSGSSAGTVGYLDADTISQYGVIEREIVGSYDITEAEATRAANLYLEKHKRPSLSIEINALDLSQVTGESFDSFTIGKLFRLTMPEDDITVEETIVALQYDDIYNAPYAVSVTLSEEPDTVVTFIHKQDRSGGGSGRAAKKAENKEFKKYETHFEKNDQYFSLLATESEWDELAQEGHVTAYSEILTTAHSINLVVEEVGAMSSRITQTASQIRAEVNDSISGAYSAITQTASQIRSEVGNSISAAYHSIIEQTDSRIRSEVGSAVSGIYTSVIEQTGSYIRSEIEAAASEVTSSVIEQTQSYIRQVVGVKTQTYVSYGDPASAPSAEIHDGDIWHKSNNTETWEQLSALDWSEAYAYNWQEYLGGITYIRKNNNWVEISNEQAVALNTQGVTETDKAIRLAKADSDNNFANLLVTASLIRSEVKDTKAGLQSSITQTASQIRMEVDSKTNAASIVLGINNQEGSYVKIQANKINLTGYVTATELSATNAKIQNLEADSATFSNLLTGQEQAGYIRVATLRAGAITFGSYALRRGYITVDNTQFQVVMWGS